ncbi:hypothetical protein RUM43_005486 [Polyplax serrata]|uniref:NADH dehydrogenase [ubiquinone] 1 beta subcomplex subunit 11, mitochondrial n=1 Tax=Polyplax serrata TaxID=468196 RepID=A0AAN8S2X1_POLSC
MISKIIKKNFGLSYRVISTTGRKKESHESCPSPESVYKKIPDFSKPLENKNWVSYGFNEEGPHLDKVEMHITFFFFSFIFFGFIFMYVYYPDFKMENWSQREAYIRLHEREQLGLEPIDFNYVDPSKIVLPPDEELQDEDIII